MTACVGASPGFWKDQHLVTLRLAAWLPCLQALHRVHQVLRRPHSVFGGKLPEQQQGNAAELGALLWPGYSGGLTWSPQLKPHCGDYYADHWHLSTGATAPSPWPQTPAIPYFPTSRDDTTPATCYEPSFPGPET
jgi:hypothetical protein